MATNHHFQPDNMHVRPCVQRPLYSSVTPRGTLADARTDRVDLEQGGRAVESYATLASMNGGTKRAALPCYFYGTCELWLDPDHGPAALHTLRSIKAPDRE
jgi:hypothetical protein